MAEEGKPAEPGSQPDTSSEQRTQDQARAAKPSSLTADAEKDAQVEAAKARVTAVKEASGDGVTLGLGGDIAAKADPFIKQRLLDLADRYDGKRKTCITPLPSAPAVAQNPSGEHDGNSG